MLDEYAKERTRNGQNKNAREVPELVKRNDRTVATLQELY